MLRPLPVKYRLAVWLAGLVACAGVGGWAAYTLPIPVVWRTGVFLGLALGVGAVLLFLHEFEHPERRADRARVRRR